MKTVKQVHYFDTLNVSSDSSRVAPEVLKRKLHATCGVDGCTWLALIGARH